MTGHRPQSPMVRPTMCSLSSVRTFNSLANETPFVWGESHTVEMDTIPKDKWKKYDGNKNWAMTHGGEITVKFPNQLPKMMIEVNFHLVGKSGKILKTEKHLVPMVKVDKATVAKHNREIEAAKREVRAGRGDVIADEAWYASLEATMRETEGVCELCKKTCTSRHWVDGTCDKCWSMCPWCKSEMKDVGGMDETDPEWEPLYKCDCEEWKKHNHIPEPDFDCGCEACEAGEAGCALK